MICETAVSVGELQADHLWP